MHDDLLFSDGTLDDFMRQRKIQMRDEIYGVPESELLGRDDDSWSEALAEKYRLEVPELDIDGQYVDEGVETQVDVSHDHSRAIFDHSTPTYVPGRSTTYHVPYSGDPVMFRLRASTFSFNPPRAQVVAQEVRLSFTFPSDRKPDLKSEIAQATGNIQQHLNWQRTDSGTFNDQLQNEALQMIRARKTRVLEDRSYLDDLGIPVQARGDAPKTYAAPGIERRPTPVAKTESKPKGKPEKLEPTLVGDFYEHICEIVRANGRSMERTPASFADRDEENLRDFFLMTLNTHYKGQATGETFQGAGKTDILVRVEDQNVFVAECKWWSGASAFSDAIDQLYSYTTLRDSKLALVVFVKAKGFSGIVRKAKEALEAHQSFVSFENAEEDGEFRATVRLPQDESKQATLHVFLFHIPDESK